MNDRRPSAEDAPGEETREDPPRVSTGSVIGSIFAAAFGVQSSRNKERDFAQGNYRHFIIGGIVFTVLFVVTLIVIVNVVTG